MPYNNATESFHTKKLYSRFSSREVKCKRQKMSPFVPEPPLWGLGATYAFHLRLIGNLVVDFPFIITELFFAMCFCFFTIHMFDRERTDILVTSTPELHTCSAVATNMSQLCLRIFTRFLAVMNLLKSF